MKIRNIHNENQDDENLKSALLKILLDLNVELPEDTDILKTDSNQEQNTELDDFENKE